jgi:NAD(P)-dependent dehydrogenase (short-subunit alcohol dehydrogenase family)
MSSIYKQFSEEAPRQHSLLLVGSMASLKYSSEPLYAAAKHGVLGLFRTLRRPHYFTSVDRNNPNPNEEGRSGQKMKVKTGLLCPFFAPTAILGQSGASQVEAGSKSGPPDIFKDMELTKISEIVEAASRLILDKEGGKAMVIMTEAMAKVAGRGRAKGGMFEVGGLEGKL